MATDLGRAQAQQGAKYDAYVAAHLGRAESRIRALDLTTGLLGFLAGTLAYAIVMAVLDRRFDLPGSARQLAFVAYLAGAGLYLARMVVRPLRRRVNPYYAARQVEQALPGAKNSVINWIDLHEQKLPPAIRGALGQRAAKDLARADLERAISGRRTGWVGAAALVLAVAFVVLFLSYGRGPFSYLMGRAFAPFSLRGPAPTRTQLTVVRPEGGNATVTVGRALPILVEVGGKVPDARAPDAVRVLYRYQDGDPYQERFLQPESAREWSTTFAAIDVRNGFFYKVVGGDAETPEYRVDLRATPQITDFRATYRYRPYVARVDEVRHDRALKALRGTRVVLLVRTNRAVKEGRVEFEGKDGTRTFAAEPVADDPEVLRVRFVLEESGQYRIHFTSTDNETFAEARFHPVTALPDAPPEVKLTKPGQDIRLPADGVLRLEGKATDDVGVKSLVLKSRVDGTKLQPRPYLSEGKLRLAGGGYARALDYKDFLDLARVKTEEGKPFQLQPGTELEYWLEASDACDYPRANVAESRHYRVKITPPEKDEKKQQQERQQAEKEQKEHEAEQNEELKKEDRARQEERKEEEKRRQEEARQDEERKKQEGQGGQDDQAKPEEGKGGKAPGDPRQSKDGRGEDKKPGDGSDKAGTGGNQQGKAEQEEKDRKADETARKLNDLLDKKEKEQAGGQGRQGEKGEGKGDPKAPGESKGDGKGEAKEGNKDGDQGKQGAQKPGAGKGGGKEGAEKEAGKEKDQGKPGEKQGAGKDEGRRDEKAGQKGAGKGGDPKSKSGEQQGAGKDRGKTGQQPERAQAKEGGAGEGQKQASKDKPAADPSRGERTARSEGKQAGAKGQTADGQPQGESKGKPESSEKSGSKGAGKEDVARKEPKAAPKGGGNPSGGQPEKSQGKGAPEKAGGQDVARSEPKPDTSGRGRDPKQPDPKARRAKPEDVEKLAQDLKSADPKKREEAARSLEKMAQQARDPEARKGARRELAKLPDAEPGKEKPGKPGQREGAEGKEGKGARETEAGKEKPGGKEGQARGDGKGRGKPTQSAKTPGSPGGMGEGQQPGKGSDTGTPKGREGEPGNEPGRSTGADRRADQARPQTPEKDTHKPSKPEPHRAATMQLERFEKLVDKKMRDDAGISDEDWKQFLRSLRDKAQREQAEATGEEKLPGPQQGNLPSARGGRPRPRPAAGPADDIRTPGRGQPPPGYRDAYSEFLRRIAADKDKK